MNLHRLLIPGIWFGWLLYWWWASRSVKPATRRQAGWTRAVYLLTLLLGVLLLLEVIPLPGFLAGRLLPAGSVTYGLGVAILLCGAAFSIWARRHLGTNWSGTVTLKQNHELIRTGPYAWVRHPIYTGLLAGVTGTAVAEGTWSGLLAVVLVFVALLQKLSLEERWLGSLFGEEYARYRAEVRALIPLLF
ncbi:MAG: isoprenylcysteine carboxylmethyltransferase family protein [Nevskia sp.]|nr:isoprenylcysteine carboxylmethyltransferase family protein [Nevskia sp.]